MVVLTDHELLKIIQEPNTPRAVCGRGGGGVVGWNYLMTLNPMTQNMFRSRVYAAIGISQERERPKQLRVVVVDREGQSRKFVNSVRG